MNDYDKIKIRIKFKKSSDFKYISHLEMSRLFIMAARRAKINLKYSEGFNPNPKINFSFPVPVGLESLGEYADIELNEYIDSGKFKVLMNSELVSDMQIIDSVNIKDKALSLMDDIQLIQYCFFFKIPLENFYLQPAEKFSETILEGYENNNSIFSASSCFEHSSDIVNLSLFGYTKHSKDNIIFKFNDFLKYLYFLSNNMKIILEKYLKMDSYVRREGSIISPLHVV